MKFLIAVAIVAQSLSYSSGQNVSPAYEGWEVGTDGQKYFVFGYMNRNWIEELDVPVGPENSFNIGGPDQGQPHALPAAPEPLHLPCPSPRRVHRQG
jgi:hypothetical protein